MRAKEANGLTPADVDADVLIVGGGFVGLALACGLADSAITSVVVEAGNPRASLTRSFDARASAIALTSRRLLNSIGVWPKLAGRAASMLEIRVSEDSSRLFLHYDHREVGDEPFGHMLENQVLRRALLERTEELPAARLLAPAATATLERREEGVEARLSDGTGIRAALAVAADGRGSRG